MTDETGATQVVIAVGGEAKRMGLSIPKALIKLGDSTLLDRCVKMLSECGFKDFVFLLGFKDERITEYLDKADFGEVKITKSYDYAPGIAKGKAMKLAITEGKIDIGRRSLMVWPDDIFMNRELPSRVMERHVESVRRLGTLSSVVVAEGYRSPYGVVNIGKDGMVESFEEKPLLRFPISTGMYIFEPPAYRHFIEAIDLEKPGPVEFESTIMPLLAKERKVYAITIPFDSWFAINTQKELEQAQKLVESGRLPRT